MIKDDLLKGYLSAELSPDSSNSPKVWNLKDSGVQNSDWEVAVTCVHEAIHRCKMRLLCLAWPRRKNFVS